MTSASRPAQSGSYSTVDMSLANILDNNLTQLDRNEGIESLSPEEDLKMASSQIPSNSPDGERTSEAAAEANDASSEDDALLNKQHFTRSKNSIKTNNGSVAGGENGLYSLDAVVGAEDGLDEAAIITECSLLLAKVDDRSYQCALVRDANQIVERITMPMSFPWHHTVLPVVRNIPRDIDEMPALLSIEDEGLSAFGDGPLGYGGFETGKQRRRAASGKEGIRIVSRRAEDVGVIELTMVNLPGSHTSVPPNAPTNTNCTSTGVSLLNDFLQHTPATEDSSIDYASALKQPDEQDGFIDGMLSLKSYTIAQARKRRKVEQVLANTQRIFVSVKVGSTSSRSSLFVPYATISTPLLREAVCPQEVQQGRALTTASAKKLAEEIGTYDCRYGAPRSTIVAKGSSRVQAGRTRLMWTYNSSSDINKVVYSTTLKRERLDLGAQKRPTNVRVGIRFNGALLALEADLSKSRLSDSKANGKPEEIPYSSKAVDAAINAACTTLKAKDTKPQCLIDTGKFLDAVRLARVKTTGGKSVDLPCGVSYVRPIIDCLPLDDGAILTTCTVSGKFLQPVCVQECLNKAARRQGLLCSVCWTGGQPRFPVEECSCGLTAHLACLSDRGERLVKNTPKHHLASKTWKCSACSAGVGVASSSSAVGQASTEKRSKRTTKVPSWLDNDQVAFIGQGRSASSTPTGEDFQSCACCPLTGGAMSASGTTGETVWIHEVCRIWQQPPPVDAVKATGLEPMACAVCGTGTVSSIDSSINSNPTTDQNPSFLTKCAANGCLVRFHPMCALFVSKLAEEEESLLSAAKEPTSPQSRLEHDNKNDIQLTNKYTLTMAQISYDSYTEYTKGGIGKMMSREKNTSLVPLAFCGFHNPERDPSLFGCYPGGLHFDEANLRIPPKRKRGVRLSH